jgi:hypothetical protein
VNKTSFLVVAALGVLVSLILSGCGGSGSSPSTPTPPSTPGSSISVTVSPNAAQTVDQSQTIGLTASVSSDSSNAGVQWTLTGFGSLSAKTSTSVTYTAAAPTGATPATITATSITEATKSASIQIAVNPAPSVTTTSVPAATVGVAYSATITAAGGTSPFTWAVTSGSLPPGLSLGSSTTNSATISGTPTAAGSASAKIQVTDAAHVSTTQALPFLVNAPAVGLVTTTLPVGVVNVAYTQTLMAQSGVPPYVWSISSGSLPAGLTLNSSSGVISGTPTAAGSSSFVVKVTDTNTPTPSSATENLSITINSPLAITTTTLPSGSVDSAYAQLLSVTGGVQPYQFAIAGGNLPNGLHLGQNGALAGTPAATGTSSFTFKVQDSNTDHTSSVVSGSLSITIAVQNCPNNASFQGNYAFLLRGFWFDNEVGSLVSDGAGNITSGFADYYLQDSSPPSFPTTVTGTYCITSNNLGTLTLSYPGQNPPANATNTLAIAVQADGNASIAMFDNLYVPGSANYVAASGVALKQDPTAFSLAKITGNYAFGLVGVRTSSGSFPDVNFPQGALVGTFAADGQGNLTNGQVDGQFSLTANDFVVSSTGRGTFATTLTLPPVGPYGKQLTLNWTFYIVDSSHLLAVSSYGANAIVHYFAGEIMQQTGGPYTNASLTGVSVIETQAQSGTSSSTNPTQAQVGLLTADGAGNFSVTSDQNDSGTLSSPAFNGTYTVSANGLVTLSIAGQPAAHAITLYLTAPNRAFLAGLANLSSGSLEPQSGGPFTNNSFSGSYFGASSPAPYSTANEVDAVTADGAGKVTGATDFTSTPGIPSTGTISGTYTVAANGRGVLTQNGAQSYLFYVVSPTKVVLLPTTRNPYLVPISH